MADDGAARTPGGERAGLPTYAQLRDRQGAPAGSSWGLFGDADELGTVALLTPQRVLAAARTVRRGAVFRLDLPIDAFDPPLASSRGVPRHTIFQRDPNHRDDLVDGLYLQATSQVDGLRHFRHWEHGFYNGVADDRVREGSPDLGIQRWAEHGIVGRGVLVDLPRYLRSLDDDWDPAGWRAFTVGELEGALAYQGVALRDGDILLLRTGWLATVLAHDVDRRRAFAAAPTSPGLEQSEEMLAWLWDHRLAMVASDNMAVEALPPAPDSPFVSGREAAGERGPHTGLMHRALIPLLGFALGELWDLDALAADCAADGVWETLLVVTPLHVVGGVGSPANVVAVK
ncbi:cyclase family protein [Polymorphospora sp. NPDC051019]|uniref:cyclase family protein n=1 Tax=Polymorphospora sp. NPDC051019 TaxID=3155725 RepID=UPI003429C36B